jgi:hypothetical protein
MATDYSTRQPVQAPRSLPDLTGERFGRLVVQAYAYSKDDNRCWACLCDCGNAAIVTTEQLRKKHKKQDFPACRACLYPNKVLPGKRYDRLVVLELLPDRKARCLCDCGNETIVFRNNLRPSNTGSCGCLHYERFAMGHTKHQMVGTREYRTWTMMKNRCLNPQTPIYKYYGGRGITICQRWQDSFEAFYADMGSRPPAMSLDRIDNNGNYEPGNCRWSNQSTQMSNTRVSWPQEQILMAITTWVQVYGRAPQATDFDKDRSLPSSTTVQNKFGSLANAREQAGLPRGFEGLGGNHTSR